LTLRLDMSTKSGATIEVEILKVFEPITMSPVMVVRLNGKKFVLKLYDRRFGPSLRKNAGIDSWDAQREEEYVDFVLSGAASKFFEFLNSDSDHESDSCESDTDISITPGRDETFLYDKCCDLFNAEIQAYRVLERLQGQGIPKLFAMVSLRTRSTAKAEHQKYFDICGILLERINGFRLSELTENAPKCHWQSICDAAVSIVNAVSDCGILNKDVRPDNFMVRKIPANTGTVYKPIMLDFALSRMRGSEESSAEWQEAKRSEDEEGGIGAVMQNKLSKKGSGYIYQPSFRYG
jgi:hypothetical protein